MSVRCPQTNLQIRIIKKKSLRGRKDFQCRYVYQYLNLLDFRFALMDRYGMCFNFACRRCEIKLHNLAL